MSLPELGSKRAAPADQETPLSGQQVQALQKQLAEKLVSITKDVELRKWAVDQATALVAAGFEAEMDMRGEVVSLSRQIHAFLTEGAKE